MTRKSEQVTIGDVAQVLHAIRMRERLHPLTGTSARTLEEKLRRLADAVVDEHGVQGIQDFLGLDRLVKVGSRVRRAYQDLKSFADNGM